MNANQGYIKHKACKSDHEFPKFKVKHPKPKKILLECGEGTGSKTFTSSNNTPFQLAHVTVDTTCLTSTEVLIKFSSLVRVERLDGTGTVRLQYELLRACEDRESISLGTWIFERVNTSDFDTAAEESFNFIFCECSTYPSCYDYFVRVTPVEVTNVTTTVSNGRIASLTQSLMDCSSDEFKKYEPKDECSKSKTKLSESKETILACGNGNGSAVFRTGNKEPVRIANVEIDTSCLCKPKVLIEFSSIISYIDSGSSGSDDRVRFQFELFRKCNNGEPISRGTWTYEIGIIQGFIQVAQGFGFAFCECVDFSDCCEYFVTLTPFDAPIGDEDNAMISNSRMTALAQSSKICGKRCHMAECKSKIPRSKQILLECGSETGCRTFTSSDDAAFTLAQVTIDTTGLYKPVVNIEFSSIVSFEDLDGDVTAFLRYELFRVCDGGRAESRGVWVLISADQNSDKVTKSFDFTFCEPITCMKGCLTYFVKVTPIEIIFGQATVSDGRIAALVQES